MSRHTCPSINARLGLALALALALAPGGCAQPVCAQPDYRDPDCRVLEENERARLRSSAGAELRMQAPDADATSSWDALGLLREERPGEVTARVAALGDFALSIEPAEQPADALELTLTNVDPRLVVELTRADDDALIAVLPADGPSLRRHARVPLTEGALWLRGALACPDRFRLVAVGDVQDGVRHFERILDHLELERAAAEEAGEPLLGLLLLGDLTDRARDDEFRALRELLARAPVPVAATPGNHDIFRAFPPSYNEIFGPGSYSFELCGARVAMLDSGSGMIADSVEARLDELIARDRERAPFLLVGTHIPAHAGLTGNGWTREDQAERLLTALAEAKVDILLTGHVHALREYPAVPTPYGPVRELIAGTAGAAQGSGQLDFGYVRLSLARAPASMEACYVEVPPPGERETSSDRPIPSCAAP
ncbi:MAG: metallophosphoesterase [Myxococcales bacterium]|nr:metallophosphoesterase [Myxococcales bacterium]